MGTGASRILIDTGQGLPSWIESISEVLEDEGISISMVLITHYHGDHTGGIADLLARSPHTVIYKNTPDAGQKDIVDGQRFSVEGANLRAVFSPGHAFDHMCFALEEENALFTGDNILGHNVNTVIENIGLFMKSLVNMQKQTCDRGYPGHGDVIEKLPRILAICLQQKLRRELKIVEALTELKRQEEGAGWTVKKGTVTVQELVTMIHGNIIGEMRDGVLEPMTEEVLEKLAGEGKVGCELKGGVRKWFLC